MFDPLEVAEARANPRRSRAAAAARSGPAGSRSFLSGSPISLTQSSAPIAAANATAAPAKSERRSAPPHGAPASPFFRVFTSHKEALMPPHGTQAYVILRTVRHPARTAHEGQQGRPALSGRERQSRAVTEAAASPLCTTRRSRGAVRRREAAEILLRLTRDLESRGRR